MTRKELERLVQDMADGRLGEEDFVRLQEELRSNESARAFYRRSMEVELLLGEAVAARHAFAGSPKPMETLLRRRENRNMKRALIAAVAVGLLCAAVLHQVLVRTPDTRIGIRFTPGTSWSGPTKRGALAAGQTVEVRFGLAEVSLPGGARGVIEGPAKFRIATPGRLDLLEGRGWFRVEQGARGFQVRTPQVLVTDLGTEFGVVTRGNELDEVHVFAGRVLAASHFGLREKIELAAGKAAKTSPVGRWVTLAPDDSGFFRELPPSLPGIRFSFDGAGALRPEGNHPALGGMKVRRTGRGEPVLVEGIRGRALSIRGFDDIVVTDWPGIGGDAPRTIACWIRCEGEMGDYSGIVSWGLGNGTQPGRCNLLVARSPKRSRLVLRFSLGHDVHFSGSTPLDNGRWYHVAAVFHGLKSEGGQMVSLYVNGRPEQVDPQFSSPPKEDQRIGTIIDSERSLPLRIGAGPYLGEVRTFLGEIDEVHIFPRALSDTEILGLAATEDPAKPSPLPSRSHQ